jgi:hypothetical protein
LPIFIFSNSTPIRNETKITPRHGHAAGGRKAEKTERHVRHLRAQQTSAHSGAFIFIGKNYQHFKTFDKLNNQNKNHLE